MVRSAEAGDVERLPTFVEQSEFSPVRNRRFTKGVVAVLIGCLAGLIVRIGFGIPLVLVCGSENGLPDDLNLILELLTSFMAGTTAGILALRWGWLLGLFTQPLKLLLLVLGLGSWTYLVATDEEVGLSFALLRSPLFRLLSFGMVAAIIGGWLGQAYRRQLLSFVGSTLGLIAGGVGCIVYALGGIAWLWFMYVGGRAFFEEGNWIKAALYILLIGPAASSVLGLVFMGLFLGVGWVVTRIYNWYALDLGLERIQ